MAACVTGQRSGCPQTSASHIRQMTRLAVESVVWAPSMRSSMGARARRWAGVERRERGVDGLGAGGERGVGGTAARRRQAQGDGAPVALAAVALDQPARLQAVGQAHDAGVRERERAAQQVQRLALGVVAQGHERGGVAARRAPASASTAAPARSASASARAPSRLAVRSSEPTGGLGHRFGSSWNIE